MLVRMENTKGALLTGIAQHGGSRDGKAQAGRKFHGGSQKREIWGAIAKFKGLAGFFSFPQCLRESKGK